MNLTYYHYSASLIGELNPNKKYGEQRVYTKPSGFWLSIPVDEDGWEHFCTRVNWNLEGLRAQYVVELNDSNLLSLQRLADFFYFEEEYGVEVGSSSVYDTVIDWAKVAANYSGIQIVPYQWACRNNYWWYNSWDCSSACIWDFSIIKSFTLNNYKED